VTAKVAKKAILGVVAASLFGILAVVVFAAERIWR